MGQLNFSPAAKPLWVCLKSPALSNVNDSLKGHGKCRIKVDIIENGGDNLRENKKANFGFSQNAHQVQVYCCVCKYSAQYEIKLLLVTLEQ